MHVILLSRSRIAAALACLCAALAACSYLPLTVLPVYPPVAPTEFLGVKDLHDASGENRLRILFIHGIGEHSACDPDDLLRHLANALDVVVLPPAAPDSESDCPIPAPTPIPVPGDHAHDTALLYRYRLEETDRHVVFDFLRWSKLTDVPKQSLIEPNLPHRSLLADLVKEFEMNNLADVLLYSGSYRDVIRPAIERGLCYFVDGAPDLSDPRVCDHAKGEIPTAVVTHSLGGYLFMDAMSDIYKSRAHKGHSAAEAVGRYLDQLYMLANQLKMLALTTRTSETEPSHVVKGFHEAWNAARTGRPRFGAPVARRQMLAISDPNDILSWEVTPLEVQRADLIVANLYLGTTGEVVGVYHTPILGLAASPVPAHLNYLTDDDVMDIIVCGVEGSQIKRCGP